MFKYMSHEEIHQNGDDEVFTVSDQSSHTIVDLFPWKYILPTV